MENKNEKKTMLSPVFEHIPDPPRKIIRTEPSELYLPLYHTGSGSCCRSKECNGCSWCFIVKGGEYLELILEI